MQDNITLRNFFAGSALSGIISRWHAGPLDRPRIIREAFAVADDMLAECDRAAGRDQQTDDGE